MSVGFTTLHTSDVAIYSDLAVTLWRVRGIDGYLYPTKLAAEVVIRVAFPKDTPDERYARLSYVTFVPQD